MSVTGIRAYIKKLEQSGWGKPDLVVIDYVDLLKTNGKFAQDDDYRAQGELVRDLRRMAGELDVAVWTATQTNRGGL